MSDPNRNNEECKIDPFLSFLHNALSVASAEHPELVCWNDDGRAIYFNPHRNLDTLTQNYFERKSYKWKINKNCTL